MALSTLRRPAAATAGGGTVSGDGYVRANKEARFAFVGKLMKGRKSGPSKIERDLVTAGLVIKPSEFLMANLIFMAVFTLIGILAAHRISQDMALMPLIKRLFCVMGGIYLGYKLPRWVLEFMANKRRSTLDFQLVDALTIISSGLKGGYSFVQGMDMAAQQLEPPIKDEFARALRLVQLGLDTPRALQQMADRVNSYDYDMTVGATNIQLAVGGNLAQLLEGIAATIRDRIRLRRDIAALTAQGRISGGILIALPIGIGVMLSFINWEYISKLITTDAGNNLLYLAGTQQAIGIYWIKKLLDFDN